MKMKNFDPNSGSWELVKDDPLTGTREYEMDLGDGTIVVRREFYATEALLEANRYALNASQGKRWGDGQVVASIPMNVLYREIMPALEQDDERYVRRWLNNSDHAAFRTFGGKV